jgi:hypothetical protein
VLFMTDELYPSPDGMSTRLRRPIPRSVRDGFLHQAARGEDLSESQKWS